ncbi:MAG: GNAT family N-acetyltransferase [Bacteroidetes bacterium]|nr:MAG: GNAT family N-acetyltransferase [Bacteroidota bacterium]
MEGIIRDNKEKNQYEMDSEGSTARLEYIIAKNQIYLTHTEVPPPLGGKGVGSSMVRQVLEDIDKRELTLIPLCPFVALYIKRNPEWVKLVMKGINIA